jgi:hypothetical protein
VLEAKDARRQKARSGAGLTPMTRTAVTYGTGRAKAKAIGRRRQRQKVPMKRCEKSLGLGSVGTWSPKCCRRAGHKGGCGLSNEDRARLELHADRAEARARIDGAAKKY